MENKYITIVEIARETKVTPQCIHTYANLGLIMPAIEANRTRLFTPDVVAKVKRILELTKYHKLIYIKEHLELLEG